MTAEDAGRAELTLDAIEHQSDVSGGTMVVCTLQSNWGHGRSMPVITHIESKGGILDNDTWSGVDAIAQQTNCIACKGAGLYLALTREG